MIYNDKCGKTKIMNNKNVIQLGYKYFPKSEGMFRFL